MDSSKESFGNKLGKRRLWLFRTLAIAVGLLVPLSFEATCRLLGWGNPNFHDDPFVGFSDVYPLFVIESSESDKPSRYRIAKSRRKFFADESFPAQKIPNTFRVFCLGGSTVQGRPYSIPTAYSTWLELSLKAAHSGKNWEVINCGGVSYASYRLIPIMEECLKYQPDLFIVCTGHNEFLEDRTYAEIKRGSPQLRSIQEPLARLHSLTLLRQLMADDRKQTKPLLSAETTPMLDYEGGLDQYHRDEQWRASVITHFEINVRRLVGIAKQNNVPVWLLKPMSNLKDNPPFKSQHRDGMSEPQVARWKALIEQARSLYRDDLEKSISLLEQAIEIDDQFAETHYELGKCHETLNQKGSALVAFRRARELDICPLRILAPMEDALDRVALETEVPYIDLQQLLTGYSRIGILGDKMLVDHVHPSIRGHQLIADALATRFVEERIIVPTECWTPRRDAAYREHRASLSDSYYFHGQQTLENLRRWAQGRAFSPAK